MNNNSIQSLDLYDDSFKFIIFGTGCDCCEFIENMRMLFQLCKIEKSVESCITAIVDNSGERQGARLSGIKISSPDILKQKRNEIIVVATLKYYREIFEQLKAMGLEERLHYIFYRDYFETIVNLILRRLKNEDFLCLVREFSEGNDAGQAAAFLDVLKMVRVDQALVKKVPNFFFDDYALYQYLQAFPRDSDRIISVSLKKILQKQFPSKRLYNTADAALHRKMEKIGINTLIKRHPMCRLIPFLTA